jgi:membrane fusion protein, multidrug efflux system
MRKFPWFARWESLIKASRNISKENKMAEENPPRSAPEAGKDSPVDPSPLEPRAYTPPARRSSKRRKNLAILALIVVVIVGGIFLWRYLGSYESTDDAQADVHLYPVSARVSGYVVAVNVGDNQWVEKGTVLVEIDPKDYEVAVAQAQANLNNALATAQSLNITVPITSVNSSSQLKFTASGIEDANAGIIAAERQLTAAHAQVEAAEANDVKAQDDLRRYKLLVDKREVSEQVYDQALAAAKSSTATIAAAQANESAAQQFVHQAQSRLAQADANHQYAETGPQQVSSTRAHVQALVADVEQKRALLEHAQLNLGYTKIVAPVSGEVNKTVVVGMNVQDGQQLLTVVPLDEVWVTANFKETQLKHMQVGQKAEIHIDSSGRTLKGHVDSIAGATGPLFSLLPPENATGNYVKIVQRIPVKIVLDPGENKDRLLRPGMNVVPDVYLR